MANIILPAVPVLSEINDSTKLLIEQAGEINRYPISDLDIGNSAAVLYVKQALTEEQKAQARANIGAQATKKETVISDNLFDKSAAVLGKGFYHSSSGTQLVDAEGNYYAYVELRGAGTYRTKVNVGYHSESYAKRVPLLKADKTWIKNITGTISDTGDRTAWDLEFTVTQDMIDAGAVYYPLTISKNHIDTVMMVKDRDYPTEYIPYGYIEVQTDVDVSGKLDNILYEKTAVFLGDSICAGDIDGSEYDGYGWAGLIGEANSMVWKNYGRNGGTITPIESVVAQSRDLGSQVNLAMTDYPNADYVIFEGGTNDADQLKETGLGVISDDFATFDTSTFSGAMENLILKILTAFPNAQVGYIVAQKMGNPPYTSAGSIRRKYFDRAVEICQKWGIPVVDLWNGSLLNPALTYHVENFYTDKQHLTLAGYQRISPMIEAWMRNMTMQGSVTVSEIPPCSTSNNGQFLRVVNGVVAWSTVPNAEEASF